MQNQRILYPKTRVALPFGKTRGLDFVRIDLPPSVFIFFIFISLLTILGPEIITFSYQEQDLNNTFAQPGADSLFGTDNLGRDLFARVLHGGRISLAVGFLATAVSLVIGVAYGMTSGYSVAK